VALRELFDRSLRKTLVGRGVGVECWRAFHPLISRSLMKRSRCCLPAREPMRWAWQGSCRKLSGRCGDLQNGADEVTGYSLSSIAFNGPDEELTKTSRCQPALFVHGLACLWALTDELGSCRRWRPRRGCRWEFTAHVAAGTFDLIRDWSWWRSAGRSCKRRARRRAGDGGNDRRRGEYGAGPGGADGCGCGESEQPGQVVISGESSNVALAVSLAKEAGFDVRRCLT